MRTSDIDTELVAANPWWRNPNSWTEEDVQLRAARSAPFDYHPGPLEDLREGGLYILRGPRRVGKSTALKQFIRERLQDETPPRHVIHVSVEGRSAQDIDEIVRRGAAQWISGPPGANFWLLDEITGVQGDWPAAIKRLRDQHPSFAADTIVLTGSSSAGFDEARKLLGGRRRARGSDRVLLQMSFCDVAAKMGADLPSSPALSLEELAASDVLEEILAELRPWVDTLVSHWEQYLEIGGYPQAVAAALTGDQEEHAILNEALWDVIHGDAFSGSGLTHTQTQGFLRGITGSLASLLSINALATNAGIRHQAGDQRLDALRRSFIAFPVPREQGLAPKPRAQAKWYFTDPALARLASSRGAGQSPEPSVLSEQQVALALLRALERRAPGAAMHHDRLLYFRSSTRSEIDFVSPDFPASCVESKYVDRAWGRAFQTIEASGRRSGIVATHSGMERHEAGWALPAGVLAYLLGS